MNVKQKIPTIQKVKLYSTGIRKIYFVFVRLASLPYFQRSPYKTKIHPLENIVCASRKQVTQFAYLVNEKHLKGILDFYLTHFSVPFNSEEKLKRQKSDFFKKYPKFDKEFFSKLNQRGFLSQYKETFYLMRCYFYVNQLVWLLDFAGSKFLKENLSRQFTPAPERGLAPLILSSKATNLRLVRGFSPQEIQALATPNERSYLEKEGMEFLKMTKRYLAGTLKERHNLLEKHLKKYGWVTISYHEEPAQTKSDCLNRIAELRRKHYSSEDIQKFFIEKQNSFKAQIKKRNKLFEKIKDPKVKKAILLLRQAAHLKDFYRGGLAQITHFYFNPLMAEMSQRVGLSAGLLKNMTDEEVEALMRGQKLNLREIKRRMESYAAGCFKRKFFLVYGEKAKQVEKKYFGKPKRPSGDLRGTGASRGQARGVAKVVLHYGDFGKVKQGDILVAYNTTPEFMPVLGKVRAIVTELGGMTSHAAIVARELNKPAIIGVKDVTKVIKDGQLVEVDANKGVVRILRRLKK